MRVCAASKETERAFVNAKLSMAQHTAEVSGMLNSHA